MSEIDGFLNKEGYSFFFFPLKAIIPLQYLMKADEREFEAELFMFFKFICFKRNFSFM